MGSHILKCAADNIIPSTVELGGKSPNIFFNDVMDKDDAFLSKAIEGAVLAYFNQGEVCKMACMSRSKFYQQFKLAFGTTPALFQQQLRLKRARAQLLRGQSISAVCFDLGFNSASHFSRVFKQAFGIAPKECRH